MLEKLLSFNVPNPNIAETEVLVAHPPNIMKKPAEPENISDELRDWFHNYNPMSDGWKNFILSFFFHFFSCYTKRISVFTLI